MPHHRVLVPAFVLVLATLLPVATPARPPLTFEERVKAQEAIERVYYAHRIWPKDNPSPKPPFEEVVSKTVIEDKVSDYLRKGAALEKFWRISIQPELLQAEMERIVVQTHAPGTLRELFAALDNDPALIAECLARPLLAERILGDLYDSDTGLHGEARKQARHAQEEATPEALADWPNGEFLTVTYRQGMDRNVEGCATAGDIPLDEEEFKELAGRTPEARRSEVVETREAVLLKVTGRKSENEIVLKILTFPKRLFDSWWQDASAQLLPTEPSDDGASYILPPVASSARNEAAADTWLSGNLVTTGAPTARRDHTCVWTGTEMIIWGGTDGSGCFNSGSRYTPATDTWSPTSTGTNCPTGRFDHTAVWSGTEMIVWGGKYTNSWSDRRDGGRYNPSTNSWIAIPITADTPTARSLHSAVWAGTQMIVWGGYNDDYTSPSYLNTGGTYSPSTGYWYATSTSNCPSARQEHTAIWTGTEMIIWGGKNAVEEGTGGRYKLAPFGSWTATSTGTDCPSARKWHTAFWTGTEMIVWGGLGGGARTNTGGRYTPSSGAGTWLATSTGTNCPSARYGHSAVWTDTEMIVWGGTSSPVTTVGGRYTPSPDPGTWLTTSTGANCPSARWAHTAVWTGAMMIVWGGSSPTNTGGRYSPYGCTDPSQPVIESIVDNDPCALTGVTITFTAGAGALTHKLVVDGVEIALGITSPYSYNPNDTISHQYLVRALNGCEPADSIPQNFAEEAVQPPGTVTVTDLDPCLPTGVEISWTEVPESLGYDLRVDGATVIPGITSPHHYAPVDPLPHTYRVRGKSADGDCSWSTPATGTDAAAPSPLIAGPSSTCSSIPIQLDAGGNYASYSWEPGHETTRTITVNPSGQTTYTVTVTDANGCEGVSPEYIVTPLSDPPPTPSISGPDSMCAGSSVALEAGGGYGDYLWNPGGETTQSITVSPSATTAYRVTVTAGNGCQGTSPDFTVTVLGNDPPVIDSSITSPPTALPIEGFCMANGTVSATALKDGTLYIGGSFTYVGPDIGSGLGFDAASGLLDSGYPKVNGTVLAIESDSQGGWYIGGTFTQVGALPRNRIAHILPDGNVDPSWDPNSDGEVRALAIYGGTVFAGGTFASIGGQPRNRIAALDAETGAATSWDPQGVGTAVAAIAVSGTTVYAGGTFTGLGRQSRNNLAALDITSGFATAWNPNPNNSVSALALGASVIYAGGSFTNIGGASLNRIAALDLSTGSATSWNPSANNSVATLALSGTTLYAGGAFTIIGGQSRSYAAALNTTTGLATSWAPAPSGQVYGMKLAGSTLYLGGAFTTIGGQSRSLAAAFDTGTGSVAAWNPNVIGTSVKALAVWGSTAYVGGDFWSAGWTTRPGIAALNAETGTLLPWNPSSGGTVSALAVSDTAVYVGGTFSSMGGQPRNNIAALGRSTGNATPWDPGANGAVNSLILSGGTVYAGGAFTTIAGQPRNRIAALDASSGSATNWNPNADSTVSALAISGSTLYAGGTFGTIGGQSRARIAALSLTTGQATPWNPSAGSGVYALAVSGSSVYAGGSFTSIAGKSRNRLASLDAFSGAAAPWNPGASNTVYALAVSGPTVYAGGSFTTVGGQGRNRLAAMDAITGSVDSWNPNADAEIYAMALSSSTVCVGGTFATVGGQRQYRLAAFPSNQSTVCTGTSVVLTSSPANSYQWKMDGGDIGGATEQTLVLTDPSQSGSYTVLATYAGGCQNLSSLRVVTINPTPAPSIVGPGAYCAGNPVTLDAGAGYASYLWSPGGQTTQTITVSPSSTTVYTVRVTTPAGCSATSPPHVVSVPPCSISGADLVCSSGDGFYVGPPGMSEYEWIVSGNADFSGPQDGPTANVVAGTLPAQVSGGPYSVDANTAFLCHFDGTMTDSLGLTPTTYGYSVYVAGKEGYGQALQLGASTTFSYLLYPAPAGANPSKGAVEFWFQHQWNWNDMQSRQLFFLGYSGNSIAITKTTYSSLQVTMQGQGTVASLGWIPPSWSPGEWHHVAVTWEGPVLMLFADGILRAQTSAAMPPSSFAGGMVIGNQDLVGLMVVDELRISNAPRVGDSPPFDFTLTLRVTDGGGCTRTCTKNVGLVGLPTPTISGPSYVCTGETAQLSAQGSFVSCFWSPGGQTTPTISVSPSETTTFSVTVTDASGCSGSTTHQLAVAARPEPAISGGPTSLCAHETAQLDAGGGYASYLWSPGGQQTQTITVAPSITTVYSVTVTDASGCEGTSPGFTVTVQDNPKPTIQASVASSPSGTIAEDFWMTDGDVLAVSESGGVVYIGGDFKRAMPYTGSGVGIDASSGTWDDAFPKANGPVLAAIPDGGGGWYIGGDFLRVGAYARTHLAHILPDRTVDPSWAPDCNGSVRALAMYGSVLLAGGEFTYAGGQVRHYIAALDTATGDATPWDPGTDGPVAAMVLSGATVYAAGNFTNIGGLSRNFLAALDAGSGDVSPWNPDAYGPVAAMALSGSTLYVGGFFSGIGGQSRNYIAAVNADTGLVSDWNPSANGPVAALAVSGSMVFAGGSFTSIGATARNHFAALDASSGSALSWNPNPNGSVQAIAVSGSVVYVGGFFGSIGGQSRNHLAALNVAGGTVTQWNPDPNGDVAILAVSGTTIYAGGYFSGIGGQVRHNLAAFDSVTGALTPWNPGADGAVNALDATGTAVYAGGSFTSVGGQTRNRIAALDLATGSATGWNPNADGTVATLAASGSAIYAGGSFTNIGGQARNRIAALDATTGAATSWDPNAGGAVAALLPSGSNVYVAGSFSNVGGAARSNIASLDSASGAATAWNPGADGPVSALAILDSRVFAGGGFANIGGQARARIAALDLATGAATPWNPSADDDVYALAASSATVLAGGRFTTIGGQARSRLAALSPSTGSASLWDPAPNGYVRALALAGSAAYAGGSFSAVNDQRRSHFAGFPLDWISTCRKATVSLNSSAAAGYQWKRDGSNIPGETNQTLDLGAPVQPGSYTIQTTTAGGCQNTSAPHYVTIDAFKPAPAITGPAAVCAGDSVTLDAGEGYTSYYWLPDEQTTRTITVNPTVTTEFSVAVSEANGCEGASGPWTVTVNPPPTPVIAGDSANPCPIQTAALNTDAGMASYHWYIEGNPIGGATAESYAATLSGAYTVQYTDGNGCTATSAPHPVTISFCSQTEVSPGGSPVPARIVFDPTPPAGYYLLFEKIPSAAGYKIYEGDIGTWYSHENAPGNDCHVTFEDYGPGQLRAPVEPTAGDHYYLVTAYSGSVEGPSGFRSDGQPIPPASCEP